MNSLHACFLFDLTQDAEERRFHSVTVQSMFLCLRLVQALVGDGHDLVEDVADVLLPAVAVRPFVAVRGRRQSHTPLDRVAGQVHPGQSLQHPGLIVHPAARGRERAAAAEATAAVPAAVAAGGASEKWMKRGYWIQG